MRTIGLEDIDDIALGSSLLGSGGGGDPYMGRLEAIAAVKEHGPVTLLDVDEVPDDWTVAPICGVGAPSVSLEKGTNGIEYPKVRAMMERMLDTKLDAFLLSEAGGMNSMVPISAAARAGLPLVNADGMGRAFPGIQQDTFTLNGVSTNPFVIADEKGNCTVLYTIDNDWTERIGREITTASGGQVTTLASPMTGAKMKTSVVKGTVDYAQKLGRIIRTASDAQGEEPEAFFLRESGAMRFFKGKICDVLRETRDGFNFGKVTLEGIGEDKGREAVVEFQNENIYAEVDGEIVATVPDLICLVDSETFVPVTTENLKYGKRVLVVGLPCDPAWRTEGGLELAGPRWFGLDVDYVPIEELAARRTDA
ncbi:DUF917 domain-containing protein [Slackia faecicanis]|uniref:DUF917 domain-containing protein n=1 Tax=Slackia faecicanis TaxID=255723 RepID=A0A3N0AG88_9ACTN|nr:DUF917 domain-containing protein [Slackia faecicanis]MDO5358447.1 DUF917 domain-containing protein [Slackia faecicanis]RNL20751.1 DUF917 domain-containing protein [Slackia faecicanis]